MNNFVKFLVIIVLVMVIVLLGFVIMEFLGFKVVTNDEGVHLVRTNNSGFKESSDVKMLNGVGTIITETEKTPEEKIVDATKTFSHGLIDIIIDESLGK